MLQTISPSVYMWSELHGAARNQPYFWNSYAVRVPSENILALIDPLAMSEDEADQLQNIATPSHVLLTCEYHLRESEIYRDRWGCKLIANEVELGRYEVPLDGSFKSGQCLWGVVETVFVPDTSYPETAFLIGGERKVLIIGDVLSGGRIDHGIPDGSIAIVGPQYFPDLSATRKSLAALLDLDYDVMCFGHGTPILNSPKDVLRRYLESDEVWSELERLKQQRGPRLGL